MEKEKYLLWLEQAENDFQWANYSFTGGFYAQTCFIAQQVGEKSLKALAYFLGAETVKGHSLVIIARELKINGIVEKASQNLDPYYISARYHDGLPAAITPKDYYERNQGEDALKSAQDILHYTQKQLGKIP